MVNVKYLKKNVAFSERDARNLTAGTLTVTIERLQHHSPTHLALLGVCADIRQGLLQGENCTFITMQCRAGTCRYRELCENWPQGNGELKERRDAIQVPEIY